MPRRQWIVIMAAAVLVLAGIALPMVFRAAPGAARDDPWAHVEKAPPPTDHRPLIQGPIATGPDATRACLKCHDTDAHDFMKTSHWTWLGREAVIAGRLTPSRIGKRNLINNYCISIQSNWEVCTACHAGYGWRDDTFDFTNAENIDCLVCHDQTGTYYRSYDGGTPGEDVDLTAVAQGVGRPTRSNCGYCHFKGGGGDAVKHGDLDGTFYYPDDRIDAHMGKHGFACVDCHRTERHDMVGRGASVSADAENRLTCESCHSGAPHQNARLNTHVQAVACQTCHIPRMAVAAPTKMSWDWSTAGQNREEDEHAYLKIKGSFEYAQNISPDYFWYNGRTQRYLMGDKIDPEGVTQLNPPEGDIHDPLARIWPFKVHRGKQVYDKVNRCFLVPKVAGEGGYWTEFDWDLALRLGSEATGLPYSGQYGFARSDMHWSITHMVATKDKALQCTDCHAENGRLEWARLGYDGDPAYRGSPRSVTVRADVSVGEGSR